MDTLLDVDTLVDIAISSDELSMVLGNLRGIVERKTTLPILSNVLIQATSSDEITITASDMDMIACQTMSADVKKKGKLTVPAVTFYEVVRTLKSGSIVNISLKNTQDGQPIIEISSGKYSIKLPYVSADNFPVISIDDYTSSFEIPAKDVYRLIDKTKFAISTEETRFYLNGIYLHVTNDNKISAVSTDLHRLAKANSEAPIGSDNLKTGIIVPQKAVSELYKLLNSYTGVVYVKASNTKVSFEFGKIKLVTKLIDGIFPEYQAAIPESSPIKVTIDKKSLEYALTLVSIAAPDKTRSVKLAFSKGLLALTTSSETAGNAREELDIDYDYDALEISFNARYLLDVLKTVDGEKVVLNLSDSFAAMMVTEEEKTEELYIVMPTR
ncbi:MAG: DNA polymerase III subunit beta [Alphaproteobacteria bacterium]|nr:DNA polymerase III subunit beta [Alphaproteobacteria bacterium]